MFRIAICDNDDTELKTVEGLMKKYLQEYPAMAGEILTFSSSEKLKTKIDQHYTFDLYLLDILMPELDGISLGRVIRENSSLASIIYITSTKDLAYEAYGVNAIQYLTKPVSETQLFRAVDRAYALHQNAPRHMVMLKSTQGIISVAQEDIIYIENQLRTALYTLASGMKVACTRTYGSFENAVAPISASPFFIQPHKSFFVNMKYIKLFQEKQITMDDGKVIPINQKRAVKVRRTYLNFLSNFLGGGKTWSTESLFTP